MTTQPHDTQTAHHHAASVRNEIVEAGTIAGLVGGVAMALFATLYAAAVGMGFWTPVKAIAATVVGTSIYELGASAVLVGLGIHVLASVVMGVVFALAVPREVAPAPALAFGAFAGVAILVVMTLVVLPIVSPFMRERLMWGSAPGSIPVVIAFVMHLIYGAGLSLAPGLRRRFNPE